MSFLARFKSLRGTAVDPFGRTEERKMERALIAQYERDMEQVTPLLSDANRQAVMELAQLPTKIRGFGPVKLENAAKAEKRREELLTIIRADKSVSHHAAE